MGDDRRAGGLQARRKSRATGRTTFELCRIPN
jgi:hypothetical protein